ncbi:MAG: MATE family efflux transporter [Clostridiales bacterium]|nr:MATE family efflux transporter [Clostridiales bacterium]MDD7346974.1 MATE family efflux transporter [Clostridiales bacterium]MDY4060532.1 MATE family efflux transporter [Anaerovoracaceae bacterium]
MSTLENVHKNLITTYMNYALPSIAAMWVFSIYTMVDGYFVGKYVSEIALASVNVSMPFVNTFFALAIILAVGTSTKVAIYLGEGKRDDAKEIFTFTVIAIIIFSLCLSIISRIFLKDIVQILGAKGDLFPLVKQYLSIILWFVPFFMVSYHFEVLVKIDGFPRLATYGVISAAISNIFLDWLFVAIFHWGIAGAALATGIAQVFSTVIFTIHFLRPKARLKFVRLNDVFTTAKQIPSILSLGTGDFLSELSTGFIVFLYNIFLLKYLGENSLVSYTIVSYYTLLISSTMTGLTQGMQPLVSYYHGKHDTDSGKKITHYAIRSVIGLSLFAIFLGIVFPKQICLLFLSSGSYLLDPTIVALRKFAISYLALGANLLFVGLLAAKGQPKKAITLSTLRGFLLVYLGLVVVSGLLPPEYIWYTNTLSEGLSLIIGIFLVREHL